jgi:hypothetical protein
MVKSIPAGQRNLCANLPDYCTTEGLAEITVDKASHFGLFSTYGTILVILFFVFMFGVLQKHVPSNDPHMIKLWGALAAACMSGVFWLAWQMFKQVFRAQRAAKK